ncbi:MAG TPA: hypothetical protein VF534_02145 [Paraburkholderia sp.]
MTIIKTSTPGPQGPPGLSWQNAWSSSVTYTQGQGVTYNGAAYVALSSSVNVVPGTAPLQWSLLASASIVQQVPTFASLPQSPAGLFLVVADETKGGNPSIYFFNASHRYWIAMVQDA